MNKITTTKFFKLLAAFLICSLLMSGCATVKSRIAFGDPHRIPKWLKRDDLRKKVKVYLDNGETVTGKLMNYDSEKLVLRKKHEKKSVSYLFRSIKRMEVVTPHDTQLAIFSFAIFIFFIKMAPDLFPQFPDL